MWYVPFIYIPHYNHVPMCESFVTAVHSEFSLWMFGLPVFLSIFLSDRLIISIFWISRRPSLVWISYSFTSGPRKQCIPDMFAFNNFSQLNNDVPIPFGGFLDLMFSVDKRIYVERFDFSQYLMIYINQRWHSHA